MPTTYKNTSLYKGVPQRSLFVNYLDRLDAKPIVANTNDLQIIISHEQALRPDLLSNELYGTPEMWWIFPLRNPDILIDPIYDFVAGKEIAAPTKQRAFSLLGRG